MKKLIWWLIVLAVLGAAAYFGYRWYQNRQTPQVTYRTAPARKTDIAQTISATGTLVPEDVIDVGAQVNGQIAEFGKDKAGKTVDYRSELEEGMVLAKIDDSLYAADLASSNAQLAQAQAQVAQAQAQIKLNEASLAVAQAKADQATRDWARAQKLGNTTAISRADYDAAQSAYEQAIAGVTVAQASITQAQANQTQAEAMVAQARASILRTARNVAYCVIKSPVSGVIIDRRVEIGQTVVASLNAPSLFLIAKDLAKMQVLVQVNEADIGHIHPGQAVSFGVDAFPGRPFKGQVQRVRLNATMTQNVVTYTVEIATDNADLTLLPYLTANVKFDVAHRDDVLAVPNAALRWSPSGYTEPETPTGKKARSSKDGQDDGWKPGAVWVIRDGEPSPIKLKTGLSDGTMTEVQGEGITDGLEVIVGEATAQQATGPATNNPFAPQMFRRRPTSGAGGQTGQGGQGATRPAGGGGAGGGGGSGGK